MKLEVFVTDKYGYSDRICVEAQNDEALIVTDSGCLQITDQKALSADIYAPGEWTKVHYEVSDD